jgi:hypothetical protein
MTTSKYLKDKQGKGILKYSQVGLGLIVELFFISVLQ